MTNEILEKIKKRDRLAKNKQRRDEFKKIRNEVIKDCRKAQINYISTFGNVLQVPVSTVVTSGNISFNSLLSLSRKS